MLFYKVNKTILDSLDGRYSIFSICAMMFSLTLIVPLFNKQTPLEEGELRTAIEDFCKKTDFQIRQSVCYGQFQTVNKGKRPSPDWGPRKELYYLTRLFLRLLPKRL